MRLKGLFLNGNEDKFPLVNEFLKKAAFLTIELRGLEKIISKQGTVQVSNKGIIRTNLNVTTFQLTNILCISETAVDNN